MRIVAHGIDLVDIARLSRTLSDHAERFMERCFTPSEQSYAEAADKRRIERLAGRFAAKEAVLKALGTGWRHGIAWTEIEITPNDAGAPQLALTGQALKFAASKGITDWLLSISHTDTHAIASVIALAGDSPVPSP
jgi:holo-[acyl-carrier protein] synthase